MDSDQDGATAGPSKSTANDDVTPEAVIDSDDDVTFPLLQERRGGANDVQDVIDSDDEGTFPLPYEEVPGKKKNSKGKVTNKHVENSVFNLAYFFQAFSTPQIGISTG